MTEPQTGGLVRPDVSESDAEAIARECYGLEVRAIELGSNQDRNFLLTAADGARTVLRIDNPAWEDTARDAQHAALQVYRSAGVSVASVLPGLDGALTQRWRGFAVRLSEFAEGSSFVALGYLAPVVLEEFGALAARSVNALSGLTHPGLGRAHMWDLRCAFDETNRLAGSISDAAVRARVLEVAEAAQTALHPIADGLPVQAIHGDLTDDNVMGVSGADSRLHPETLLDFGDLSLGWRVAELAVTVSSMLHHDPARPLRVLDTIVAFHREAPLSEGEARALWPLVQLRAALLVASGHRQLEVDGGNEYAKDRLAGEQAIFDAATRHPLLTLTESVLATLGFSEDEWLTTAPRAQTPPLQALLPDLTGGVAMLDPGVESEALEAGRWLLADAEDRLVAEAFSRGSGAAVFPYGVFRLTRTEIDAVSGAATWPANTEIRVSGGAQRVTLPASGRVLVVGRKSLLAELAGGGLLGIHGIVPTVTAGDELSAGAELGALNGDRLFVGLRRSDAMSVNDGHFANPQFVTPELVPAWRRLSRDPAELLGLPLLAQSDEAPDEVRRRERIFARAQERYYERPMQIERGWQHHLVDTTGRSYVDIVNNVAGIGHGHPGVAEAASRQIRILNTNSRFLYRELAEYSERLLDLLPEEARKPGDGRDALDTVLLVNSGSEAVDLGVRLMQAATGRQTIVSLREAYHGWTMASDAVTTSAYDNPYALASRPDWIFVADVPNEYRGTHRGDGAGPKYAADLGRDLEALAAGSRDVAGFICESLLGNAGGVRLPDGYLSSVYARVRAAGGLCLADEVQVGFGRMGSTFWGFEQSGVIPDLIAIAKPMGNGFPIGGVMTSKRVADALTTQGQFFSSAGGNPLSCRVGIAVLDAMRDEGHQENARLVGAHLRRGFEELAERHPIIGFVHGVGLYLGVELVRDRETLEPATSEAAAICERLRELGVIVLTTSERSNVLKIKPPLTLTKASADFVIAQLDRVLQEGW